MNDRDRRHLLASMRGSLRIIGNLRTSTEGSTDAALCRLRDLIAAEIARLERLQLRPEPTQMEAM